MGRRARGGVGRGDGLFLPDAKSKSDRIRPWNSSSLPLHRRWLGSLSTTQSISSHLAYLYLETRPPIYLSPLSPPLPPSALPSTPMNSTAHSQHLIDSSRRVLEQVCLSLPLSASLCVCSPLTRHRQHLHLSERSLPPSSSPRAKMETARSSWPFSTLKARKTR